MGKRQKLEGLRTTLFPAAEQAAAVAVGEAEAEAAAEAAAAAEASEAGPIEEAEATEAAEAAEAAAAEPIEEAEDAEAGAEGEGKDEAGHSKRKLPEPNPSKSPQTVKSPLKSPSKSPLHHRPDLGFLRATWPIGSVVDGMMVGFAMPSVPGGETADVGDKAFLVSSPGVCY
jgi:hypothetical protein